LKYLKHQSAQVGGGVCDVAISAQWSHPRHLDFAHVREPPSLWKNLTHQSAHAGAGGIGGIGGGIGGGISGGVCGGDTKHSEQPEQCSKPHLCSHGCAANRGAGLYVWHQSLQLGVGGGGGGMGGVGIGGGINGGGKGEGGSGGEGDDGGGIGGGIDGGGKGDGGSGGEGDDGGGVGGGGSLLHSRCSSPKVVFW